MNSELIILTSTLGTGFFALIGLLIKYCFASKCSNVKCCCIEIQREITHENNINNVNNEEIINIQPQIKK
jgi:hypothetical protein